MPSNKVIDYFNQCHKDYQILWGINRNFSMHYGFYDKNHKKHDDAVLNMNRVLAQTAKITSKDKILDAGCGIGGSAIWLAKNFGSKVKGININKMQVEIARKLARKNNVDSLVKFFVRDFMNTKFPDNSFDVVWTIESMCYAKNKKDFLSETKRILKEEGRIVFAEGFFKKENFTEKEQKNINKALNGWVIPNLASVREFKKYLKELKFKNIKFRDITENVMHSSRHLFIASIFAYPVGKFLEWVGIRTSIQTGNIITAYYQHITLKKGLWIYGIFYAEK